ncbi:lipopolysaccharide transport periplasmic protein LptA [Marinobacterium sediminicola]|uniref:Lipopolysaccharide export system protein LptA n=1 Tax=Marinobacterium sediminicola TaxID=518898 RepID=A0ABY1RY63_9GAMM|nr:lipopolysaccharide transport periplasmic protein LptA [Marinobacterium sediminicola]ULG68675.1 lipopolysaccharide transport periplasmic protein LptA [Marinobacterium sediminicola]SMR73198.1 lipopolysaccharide export system protein LptA [Marinobacterium sediminicola]
MCNKLSYLLLATLLTLPSLAQALPDDRQQPIHISADSASMNERSGITVYTGNVEIVQGTMIIRGARVELHRNDAGVQRIISTGNPAQFQQQPSRNQPVTKAYGERMDYRVNKQEITITESARVDQGRDTFTGERIIYNMEKAVVNAYGSDSDSGQRVQMVIQPKTEGN